MEQARERAGLLANATTQALRHSFATHLHEDGTDLRYVQELLSDAKPETTMVYAHITRRDLKRIRSPLDNIARMAQSHAFFHQPDMLGIGL